MTGAFWCLQIAERHWNAHAFINIAALLNVDSDADKEPCGVIKKANVILGYPSMSEGALLLVSLHSCNGCDEYVPSRFPGCKPSLSGGRRCG